MAARKPPGLIRQVGANGKVLVAPRATPTALKAKAGHSNMATTDRYIKLAGVVFRQEAEAQAARLLGPSTNLLPDSHDLTASRMTVNGLATANEAG